jgi:putative DNA methylase
MTVAEPQGLAPFSLKDAPSFIEAQFPVGRLSEEARKERKAGSGQTLTALGSYWKGRKPLILCRAVVLGALLPATNDPAKDLDIFLKLMAMDDGAFGRRFDGSAAEFARLFPAYADLVTEEVRQRRKWREDLDKATREARVAEAFATLPYKFDQRLKHVRRPEECDEAELLGGTILPRKAGEGDHAQRGGGVILPRKAGEGDHAQRGGGGSKSQLLPRKAGEERSVWPEVNAHLGTSAGSLPEFVEQLGIARFGHRPKVGDTFCGGGSIPFEAARIGCDVYASDLNPIACMLTWGAFNIIGASPEKRAEIENAQREVAAAVDAEITRLGIEHDEHGNRAKAFLYCLEARCPKTGWMVPMAPSWVISKTRNVVAKLVPDHAAKRYEIQIHSGVSEAELAEADKGTVLGGRLVHPMNPERSGVEIKTIRGDYRDSEGTNCNRLRMWEKEDFIPRPDDIFQERLYCIQWIRKASLGMGRQETFFATVTKEDLARERKVEVIVRENLARWQDEGLVPEMRIEPGEKTDEPIRTRGWRHWHHLFGARHLLLFALIGARSPSGSGSVQTCKALNRASKLCRWNPGAISKFGNAPTGEKADHVFMNQALNTLVNYSVASSFELKEYIYRYELNAKRVCGSISVWTTPATDIKYSSDIFITDPPYADAINYHEITEFFIAWLHKNPPPPFDQWTWNSQRDLAIKGKDEKFRRDMAAAYAAMTKHMPDDGLQVVMFTHQDAGVWADLGAILWAAGLRVTAAWNIVTETESALKEGNYVKATICLVLRKRLGESNARRMEIEAEIEDAVREKLDQLTALDDSWHERANAETLYTDGDLTLAAYAAALQVVTSYSTIDRQPLDRDLYRKLAKGERTMIRNLVDYAAEVANNVLVPEHFPRDMWRDLSPPERFYVRMLDMESKGATKVADFQNFAKSFAYGDYASLMASTTANAASLKGAWDLTGQMLGGEGFGGTQLRQVLFAVWKTLEKENPKLGVLALKTEYAADYWQRRQKLIALAEYIAAKTKQKRPEESAAAHELAEALSVDRV